ncbi:UDP-N-acetylglucosamine--peptide N-acetylglucosaminyltransferase, putative [Cyanobium sp. PCC 7001]|uniref:O-linked N-acetylglucosamine transferase, SPINDLY family protein n=1 Tax=Cyanobium sp. PCC 7001 TaxID=180281 RepID=UPI0001805070|nr:tetratricopeptide repeat protein [Cyanobium sp. PCC 7001]EDY38335.1 UDP-N-acetylglucosamine--peptide N-acetylglucosaminyltransferase, putative [Cyanobium sp. PCC 7001]
MGTSEPDATAHSTRSSAQHIAALWRELRAQPIQPGPWLSLSRAYRQQQLAWQAAATARQACRLDPRLEAQLAAEDLAPPASALVYPDPLPQLTPAALEALGPWLDQAPGDWLSALLWLRWGDGEGSAPDNASNPDPIALARAVSHEPIAGETLHWLGLWRLQAGDPQGAVEAFKGLVNLQPQRHGSMLYLGEALLQLGNTTAAEKAFTRASHSRNPAFLRLLAERVYANNYWQEAIPVLERALELQPADVPTLVQLAKLHWEVYNLSQAQDLGRQVLAIDPANAEIPYLLNALPGRLGDARAHFEAVQAHHARLGDPGSRLASSIAMASLYCDHLEPGQVAALHRELCAPISARLEPARPFPSPADPHRRPLRLGLLSADFHRQHPVNLFMLPLLQRFNREELEVSVYATGGMVDVYTRQARQAAAHWVEAAPLDDGALQRRIRDDGIDILLDLAGHTSSHRLGVLALRAAPVQATFLGYPHSTGLTSIDWLIGDPVVSPAEHAHLFSEGIAQLPHSVFCWAPVDAYPLPRPRAETAPVVFGCFNNVMKLSPSTIALWARILQAVPESSLLLKAPSLRDGLVRHSFQERFAAHGIGPHRLRLEGPTELSVMMQTYGQIDIGLDPFPYNGGTTTLQALWMGVPVVVLEGGNFVSRMGASFLTSLGRPEWIGADPDSYARIAVALASQVHTLRRQRAELRERLARSPLGDIEAYSRDFERLLGRLWRAHTEDPGCRLLMAEPATTAAQP